MSEREEQFGRYTLLDRIASGGMAEIFKARYSPGPDFSKIVVIKRILPNLADDEEFVTMFRDEARITVQLNHTNIVQVFDFGKIGGCYFLAMEYVQGPNLSSVLRRCNPSGRFIPVPICLFIAREIAKGLHYAHTQTDEQGQPLGIVHRDVSPSNVLVSYQGEVKITDFGIAKAASRISGTQQGIVKGKLSYMSPEQIQKGSIDGRADVFALGVLLWECLAGSKLFSGDHVEVMREIVFDQPDIDPPSLTNPQVPKEVDDIVLKALAWDRRDRFTTDELMRELQTALRGEAGAGDLSAFIRKVYAREITLKDELMRAANAVPSSKLHDIEASAEAGATKMENFDVLIPLSEKRPALGRETGQHTMTAPIRSLLEATQKQEAEQLKKPAPSRAPWWIIGGLLLVAALFVARDWLFPGPAPATPTPTEVALASPSVTTTEEVVETTAPSPPGTIRPTQKPTPALVTTFGFLSLQSEPWAEIYVDGKKLDKNTPYFNIKLKTGRRKIELKNPLVHKGKTIWVTIEKGKTIERSVVLEKLDPDPK